MVRAFRPSARDSYHHGNLGPALIDAAVALLDETQDWAFSLREVARRAGVSHNAPYKHFPEKRDLLAAVAARGFEALAERMLSSLQGLTSDPRAELLACGRAFVEHGVANPALYRLMFSAALTNPEAGRPLIEKAAAAKARSIFDADSRRCGPVRGASFEYGESARKRSGIPGGLVFAARAYHACNR